MKARRLMPDAAIGADVMTGFPGETDALFEESRQFIEQMPLTYLHVFTYSERPGTKAVTMEGRSPNGSAAGTESDPAGVGGGEEWQVSRRVRGADPFGSEPGAVPDGADDQLPSKWIWIGRLRQIV